MGAENRQVGRPRKSIKRRIPITIYVDQMLLEKLDTKLFKMKEFNRGASRSELYHLAMSKWLNEMI